MRRSGFLSMDFAALTGSYEIMDGERAVGTLEVSRQGGYFRFRAACSVECGELMRLAVRSGERTADLGVLAPEEGLWRLDKRFSPAALRALGIGEIGACFLCRMHYFDCPLVIAVMIRRHFRYDVHGIPFSDFSVVDYYFFIHSQMPFF